jgi:hypothetical protein
LEEETTEDEVAEDDRVAVALVEPDTLLDTLLVDLDDTEQLQPGICGTESGPLVIGTGLVPQSSD